MKTIIYSKFLFYFLAYVDLKRTMREKGVSPIGVLDMRIHISIPGISLNLVYLEKGEKLEKSERFQPNDFVY